MWKFSILMIPVLLFLSCGEMIYDDNSSRSANLNIWNEEIDESLYGVDDINYISKILDGNFYEQISQKSIDPNDRWISMNHEIPGTNGIVSTIIRHGDYIFVGGSFTIISNITANNIAMFHVPSGTWSALGSGVSGGEFNCFGHCILSLSVDKDGNLYAGGWFDKAGDVEANRIAKWNGDHWSALGSGITGGTQSKVNTIAIDNENNIYVAGQFTTAGSISANNIAKWDGTEWTALGTGLNSSTLALALNNDGNLFAAGLFTMAGNVSASKIAMWDGNEWSSLGSGIGGNYVQSMKFDNNGNLYVGGDFSKAGEIYLSGLAIWNGEIWSSLPLINIWEKNIWTAIEIDISGNIYVGGESYTSNNIVKWNGESWSQLAGGVNNTVRTLAFDMYDNLYVGGEFSSAGEITAKNIAKWNGASWNSIGNGLDNVVFTLEIDNYGNLLAGGMFVTAGNKKVNHLAIWNGSEWSPIGSGFNGRIYDITIDINGNIYVGGSFTKAGTINANSVAKWDGVKWNALGAGTDNTVITLASDSNGILYVGGEFNKAGGQTANNIAKWDGINWSSMGNGTNNIVESVVIDISDNVYIGGWFSTAGSISAKYVAKWNGTNWSSLGTGVIGIQPHVASLTFDKNGNLFAAGEFSSAGGIPANNIAKWNGSTWSALNSELTGDDVSRITSLKFDNIGNLYVGGIFTLSDNITFNNIAKWDGSKWHTLGTGLNNYPQTISIDSTNNIYVGGFFETAGGKYSPYIAKYLFLCGNGILDENEECEANLGILGTCCDPSTCKIKTSDKICREKNSDCDQPETCDGITSDCPEDSFIEAGTVCNAATYDCELDAKCTGDSPFCPSNPYKDSTVKCAESKELCENDSYCTGSSYECPGTTAKENTIECRGSAGVCDQAEFCDGTNKACPADTKLITLCRESSGDCDIAEFCNGINPDCPENKYEPDYTECQGDGFVWMLHQCISGTCDSIEELNGSCSNSAEIKNFPFEDISDITGRPDHIKTYGNGCEEMETSGSDVVYKITVRSGKIYTVSVQSDFDAALAIIRTCRENEECLYVKDKIVDGDETIIFETDSSDNFFIVIESVSGNGTYKLSVIENDVEFQDDTDADLANDSNNYDGDSFDSDSIETDDNRPDIDFWNIDEDFYNTDNETKNEKDLSGDAEQYDLDETSDSVKEGDSGCSCSII